MANTGDGLFREAVYEEANGLTQIEENDLLDAEPEPVPVTYSGQDFDIEGLVRRMRNSDILIPTFGHFDPRIHAAGFQRGFVWTKPQMDRFVESLLLGYPIPGVFFVRQWDRRYLVLDGQQRLRTLRFFYDGMYNDQVFSLSNVGAQLKGLTYESLQDYHRRTLDNSFIQATIVDTDGSTQSLEAIYQIFERLNAGGTQLTPHEIRVALYPGEFIDFLDRLNQVPMWRELYGRPSSRLRDQELILRIVAAYVDAPAYARPQKSFLNKFTARNREHLTFSSSAVRKLFEDAAELFLGQKGKDALRPRGSVNAAFTEAVFVGLMRRLEMRPVVNDYRVVARAVDDLAIDEEMDRATTTGTAEESAFRKRMDIATDAFARI